MKPLILTIIETVIWAAIWKCVMLGIAVAVDRLVVQRRDAVVPRICQLQSTLKIPPCLFVVSNTAPGITDKTLQVAAEIATSIGLWIVMVFGLFASQERVKGVWGVVAPVYLYTMLWAYLIFARRRFDKRHRDTYVESAGGGGGTKSTRARNQSQRVLEDSGSFE
ncbi:hypothetical protein CIB48_g12011 [Xylaria polymorpha]|nr:hypothetical protein CIB48_g12011 [Xylaria polymorpha]